ncbi:hypothetical protein BKA67DRAFT_661010 [Truncatella angustata]|uniref:Xylanolytic transcriptional activator regulatory domain-containing protein n=1 Tax=Truncatella angustata TaxID=152316 RepID=A0A9P8UHI4_9PEZI|nr:uncharacterized protein BKA67DRAFT_661010 [Truncatella angustata]KAH6652251.1 hypothetical protein BKA67DRAFT_661010 [Truncatella angustata]
MAEIMKLDIVAKSGSIIEVETARRIWSSLYMADYCCSVGHGIPRCLERLDSISWHLPMDEITFRLLRPDRMALSAAWKPGLWAHMVTLVRLAGPVHDLNRRTATGDTDNARLDKTVEQLGQQLESWLESLPSDVQMTVQNLNAQQQTGLGGLFISLHLGYHHYSTLLYFRFLESQQASIEVYRTYIKKCKYHAASFSSLLHLSRQMKNCGINYPTIGHMTAVASSVLVHTLLFGNMEETEKARRELNNNFEALIELRQHWPAAYAMIHRLMTFQNICLLSTQSYKLDGWMVRYLLEHSLPLEKRDLPIVLPELDLDMCKLPSNADRFIDLGRYTDFEVMSPVKWNHYEH